MSYVREILREVSYAFRSLNRHTPEVAKAFKDLLEAALTKGKLTLREKELVLVGVSVALRCEPCTVLHIKKALEAGADPEEIAEAIAVTVLMGGGPVITTSAKAFKALEELSRK
ncbi:carboxymuconolactone decarboxylase family protein [archaeon]|nr:MAG: carboxymuconolactone decarboxylase family protein [archaeon]RLG64588.1 MAG: carboxymuconolactone decarboxylase family protein [archaeon]RLG66464.1 MAG: carboxymuconolactone decarboxylase family protein [archaeon]HDM24253.1 carboxymuconolactone decarboxylase family protein [Candidatus Bathyarchaeota archaeon]